MSRSIFDLARSARLVATFLAAAALTATACAPVESDANPPATAVSAQGTDRAPGVANPGPDGPDPGGVEPTGGSRGKAVAEPFVGGVEPASPAQAEPFPGAIEPASPTPGAALAEPVLPSDIAMAAATDPSRPVSNVHALARADEPARADQEPVARSTDTPPRNLDDHRVRIEPVLTTNDAVVDGAPRPADGTEGPRDAAPELIPAVVDAQNRFGDAVFGHLASAEPHGNIALSPLSVASALTMTRAGAQGTTADQMDAVLHLGGIGDDPDDVHAGLAAYQVSLADAQAMTMANRVWLQDDVAFEQPFLDRMTRFYGAGAELIDFDQSTAAQGAINDWVNDHTKDRIPKLIPNGVIDSDTQMVLTNALTFDGQWTTPFDPDLTASHAFVTAAGDTVDVDMMHNSELVVPTGVSDGVRVVELPYDNDDARWSMVVAMPEGDTTLGELENRVRIDGIDGLRAGLNPTAIDLRVPRFSLRQNVSLPDVLTALGMPDAFVPTGDFRPMSHAFDDNPLYVDDVIHEAMIEVDEAGTKAAAATAVVMATESAAMTTPVTIDRAFVFAIVDTETGGTIFMGRVANPDA